MRFRRPPKADANQKALADAFAAAGATVASLHAVGRGVPDLLVGYLGRTFLVEVKRPEVMLKKDGTPRKTIDSTHRQTRERQEKWRAEWRGEPVRVLCRPEDVLSMLADVAKGA